MGDEWVRHYVNSNLEKHSYAIFRGGKNFSRHVFLVTPMQTLEHIVAMTKILDSGFVNQPERAQVFAEEHAKHDVQKEFGDADLKSAEKTFRKSGKPKRPKKNPRKGPK